MKYIDKRLSEYRYLRAKIYSIDLDIEYMNLYGKCTKELEYFKARLIKEVNIIDGAIDKLKSHENFMLNMFYINNMSMSEVSKVLNINRSTCYDRKYKILKKIIEYI